MDNFFKLTAVVIIALILHLVVNRYGKDFSTLLTIIVCAMVLIATISFIEPVLRFVNQLVDIAELNSEMLEIMLKAAGIGLLAEITGMICTDAGNSALGKSLQILAAFTILWLALPLFNTLINIIREILVAI